MQADLHARGRVSRLIASGNSRSQPSGIVLLPRSTLIAMPAFVLRSGGKDRKAALSSELMVSYIKLSLNRSAAALPGDIQRRLKMARMVALAKLATDSQVDRSI